MERHMRRKKVCIIGAAAVGKTCLVASYSGESLHVGYRSTLGARITTAAVSVQERLRGLVLWDIKGETEFYRIPPAYLYGCEGCVLVADGTRASTVEHAMDLLARVETLSGGVPHVMLVNKLDLSDRWEVGEALLSSLRKRVPEIYTCSARGGITVQTAMETLARKMWGMR
jgi:small GTP-binding protein